MFGWTLLLLGGYQKPDERKNVLLLTIIPVITGLMASRACQLVTGLIPLVRIPPTMLPGAVLIGLMGFGYFNAGAHEWE